MENVRPTTQSDLEYVYGCDQIPTILKDKFQCEWYSHKCMGNGRSTTQTIHNLLKSVPAIRRHHIIFQMDPRRLLENA